MTQQATELIASQAGSAITNQKTWGSIIYNVKDPQYGAKGNGIANDTAAIQKAINEVQNAGGGIVYVPNGVYSISSQLLIAADNVSLIGSGPGAIIRLANNAPDGHVLYVGGSTGTYKNITIKDITLDANIQNRGTGKTQENVVMRNVNNSLFDSVRVLNSPVNAWFNQDCSYNRYVNNTIDTTIAGVGFYLFTGDGTSQPVGVGSNYNVFEGNIITNIGYYSGVIACRSRNNVMTNNQLLNIGETGFELTDSYYTVCNDNSIINFGKDGPTVGKAGPGGTGIGAGLYSSINGNVIDGNNNVSSYGLVSNPRPSAATINVGLPTESNVSHESFIGNVVVKCQTGHYINGSGSAVAQAQIIGNTYAWCLQDGMILDNAIHMNIQQNTFFNNGQAANNTYHDIVMVNSSGNNVIRNNIFFTNATIKTAYGVSETGGNNNFNEIHDNKFKNHTIAPLQIFGSATKATGNSGYNGSGWAVTTPTVPNVGSGNAVTNSNPFPVRIYMSGQAGTHIIDPAGTDRLLPGESNEITLEAGAKIYFATTKATGWYWYGL